MVPAKAMLASRAREGTPVRRVVLTVVLTVALLVVALCHPANSGAQWLASDGSYNTSYNTDAQYRGRKRPWSGIFGDHRAGSG